MHKWSIYVYAHLYIYIPLLPTHVDRGSLSTNHELASQNSSSLKCHRFDCFEFYITVQCSQAQGSIVACCTLQKILALTAASAF